MTLAPGIYPDLPAADYHALPYLGGGDIHTLAKKTAAHFREYKDRPESRKEPDRPMQIGSVCHILALEPQRFDEKVVIVAADKWTKKADQEARDDAFARGLTPILESDMEVCHAMNAKLREYIGDFFSGGSCELSAVAEDPMFGAMCKMRADYYKPGILVDFKTTEDASKRAFMARMSENGHNTQAEHYRAIIEILTSKRPAWKWIVQETKRPYVVQVYEPSAANQAKSAMLRTKALNIYNRCIAEGVWPGYARQTMPVDLPGWEDYQLAEAEERGDFKITHTKAELIQLGIKMQAPQ